jgi:hypothetical protein
MLVKVLAFGSNWWRRSRLENDPARLAYYNSTGIRRGRKTARHWLISGILRLNGVSNFDPTSPARCLGVTFEADLGHAFGGNRLLLKQRMPAWVEPEIYLVVVRNDLHGRIDFACGAWKSVFAHAFAVSALRDTQETMLLMHLSDWIQTASGFWQLQATGAELPRLVCLEREVESDGQP